MFATIERAGFRFAFAELRSPTAALPPGLRAPFGCLLWDGRAASSEDDRGALTATLLAAGCATLACGGADCEAWHDAADEQLAAVNARDGAERFIMTTWHASEPPERVAEYFADQAVVDDRAVRENIVLYLGVDEGTLEQLRHAIDAEVRTPYWDAFASDAV